MVISSRTSTIYTSMENADSTWDLVNFPRLIRKDDPLHPTARHRRGRTEGLTRRSIFKLRSRSHTLSNASMGHTISPSISIESQDQYGHDKETSRPQSSWSDSDQSDDMTKSWVMKGSKILKKQNSKFNLGSSRRSSWFDESEETGGQYSRPHPRNNDRAINSGRPMISTPFNFRHMTHTQAHQFANLHSASQQQLMTDFSAIRASQAPQYELQGIKTEDLRSPTSGSSSPRYPVTPPALSPTKVNTPRSKNGLSINAPETLFRSRSIDNFSQPSPKAYRTPRSPTTPPAIASSRHVTSAIPDFFSDIHHATPSEREILSRCDASAEPSDHVQPRSEAATNHVLFDENIPHAITTSEDIALTLKPSLTRRSALALADVPEEDELRSIKRVSDQSHRPVTADPALRHATTFPSSYGSPDGKRISTHASSRLSCPNHRDPIIHPDDSTIDASPRCQQSRKSTKPDGIEACWEDDIDYCYQLEAEANCDFDWDRLSMDRILNMDKSNGVQEPVDISESLPKKIVTTKVDPCLADANSTRSSGDHHLPRLQTSLPELDFSAASSAKSSMASLRGPITPLQQLPSPRKSNPMLQLSKSTDTLNLESSFLTECDSPWLREDSHKAPSWDHASQYNYPFNNLNLSGISKATSRRSSRPLLSTHQSSDSVLLSKSVSAVHTRRNTSSSSGFPELICSKNYRQHANIVAEQIADRIAALAVTDRPVNNQDATSVSDDAFAPTHTEHNLSPPGKEVDDVPSTLPSKSSDPAMSVASFADRLRSNSVTSSASGTSSMRTSRISYSLFPTPPSTKVQAR